MNREDCPFCEKETKLWVMSDINNTVSYAFICEDCKFEVSLDAKHS